MATRKKTSARKTTARKSAAGGAAGRAPTRPAARKRAAVAESYEDDTPSEPGSTSLVIVESPAKAKTIGKYLGRGYRVRATVGHVRDLPERQLGVDVDNGFKPTYVTIEGKEPVLNEIKKYAKDARTVYIATDPDREGEAIGWHVAEQLKPRKRGEPSPPIRRVLFHEITKDAVQKAIAQSREIDLRKVDAQQARRVLDRIVGYKASPLLWKTVKKGLSAGRVQTVALRLIVEREREIRAFKPEEYWSIEALLDKDGQQFTAKLHHVDGKKIEIPNEAAAQSILDDLKGRKTFGVTDVKRRERRKNPAAPFTTSTLQQEAAKKLGFGSKRTMRLAQDLYEGIDIGEEGQQGLITYMRTDSSRVAESAAAAARDHLRTLFGQEYLADGPRLYGSGKDSNAQDAHEGVRPTDPTRRPDLVKRYLKEDQFKLYQLIWQRFMASQMAPAVFDTTTVDFDLPARQGGTGRRFLFRATGSVVKFPGFLALYKEAREETEGKALEDEQALPVMNAGDDVPLKKITPNQHFTEPPPRFSEASLVKELERLGIGRPSTYASIISVLVERRYVDLQQRRFFPTEVGETVAKVMIKQFPDIFDVNFTSRMEVELDKIADGELGWTEVLSDFYDPFNKRLQTVDEAGLIGEAHDLSALAKEKCPDCGGKLVAKAGFFGPYIGCVNHPKACKFTRPLKGEKAKAEPTEYKCPECGSMMLKRQSRNGEFLGCSKFPKCRGTRSMPTGVKCPKDGGDIAERRSKARGKKFWGCENYPNCDFVVWDKPVPEKCPECGYLGAESKRSKTRGEYRKCIKCQNEWNVQSAPDDEVVEVA